MTKTSIILTKFVLAILLLVSPAFADQKFIANLSGGQEVPANDSTGTGLCSVSLNLAETQITVTCSYTGLSGPVNAAAIHGNTAPGANAAVLFDLNFAGGMTDTIGARQFAVTSQQVADLKGQRLYINVKTGQLSAGEIRGQIKRTDMFNDVDGEGRADVLVRRPGNNTFYVQPSLALQRGLPGAASTQQFGLGGDITATGDFDGDGKADLIALRVGATNQVTWFILQSSDNSMRAVEWGSVAHSDFPAASDFDGDGKADIAVYRRNNGVWYIIESSTGALRYEAFGDFDDQPMPGDYDKDGKDDIAVVRGENGQSVWYIHRSSDGAFRTIVWGLDADHFFELLPVDVDGDGMFDPLVYRDGSDGRRTFYALRSSDDQAFVVQWGLATDTPLIGDYDGDGKTDLVARRIVGGSLVWYIYQSSNGQTRIEYWGVAQDH